MKRTFLTISFLSCIAIVNASYLSYKAFFFRFIDPQGLSSFCDVSQTFSCSDVLRHPLSQVFGISFPWIALLVYPVLLAIAYVGYKTTKSTKNLYAKTLTTLSFLGMLFNGFIIYREVVYIHTYCLLCLLCSAIIVTIFGLSLSLLREK